MELQGYEDSLLYGQVPSGHKCARATLHMQSHHKQRSASYAGVYFLIRQAARTPEVVQFKTVADATANAHFRQHSNLFLVWRELKVKPANFA